MENDPMLKKWINPAYLEQGTIKKLQEAFQAQHPNSLHLQNFLLTHKADTLLNHLKQLHYRQRYKPDQYRYSVAPAAVSCKPFFQFLVSPAMREYLQQLTGREVHAAIQEIVSFQHQDYTLLHDEQQSPQGMRFVLDFTPQWNHEAGGYEVCQVPEHDPLIVHPSYNALTLLAATPDLHVFTKYVNGISKGRKQYRIQGVLSKQRRMS